MKKSPLDIQYNMFQRANDGDTRAHAKIIKDNLFDVWVSWNVVQTRRFAAFKFAHDWLRTHPDDGPLEKLISEYEATALNHEEIASQEMANWCMETMFAGGTSCSR